MGGRCLENDEPAEPDDPNSSSPNPNKRENWGWASVFQGAERGNGERRDLKKSPEESQNAWIL